MEPIIHVVKRDGSREPLDISKIQKQTSAATQGLKNVSQSELELDAKLNFIDGITSEQIQQILIKTAVDKIDLDKPDWTFVAARLFLFDLTHKVRQTYKQHGYNEITLEAYLAVGKKENRLLSNLGYGYDLTKLQAAIDTQRDYLFNYLGIKTLYDRYLVKDFDKNPIETPQLMFMGIAMFLAQNESPETKTDWAIKFYNTLSTFKFMLATPTLTNARTLKHQLSSCFVGSAPDNIEGIFDSYKEMSLLSKFGGGVGWDFAKIRATGSQIRNHRSAAGGLIPFLKILNDITVACDQLGSRKGAAAIYIEPWHLDVEDFLDLKKNSGEERRRTHELFPALWINGLFMDRVAEDKDWTLFDPYEVPHLTELYGDGFNIAYEAAEQDPKLRKQTIRAKDLWKHILTSYYESGSPFLTFKDRANITNPNKHTGVIHSTNLCSEIFQSTEENQYKVRIYLDPKSFENKREFLYNETDQIKVKDIETREGYSYKPAKHITSLDTIIIRSVLSTTEAEYKVYAVENVLSKQGKTAVCNLGSLNLSKVNKTEDIKQIIPIAVRMLDNVIDLNFYPVKKTKDTNLETRAIGLGVMGEAEYLAQQNIVFGSQAHYKEIDRLMSDVSYYTIEASSDLAKEKKPYDNFKGSLWDQGIFPLDFTNSLTRALAEPHQQDWDALKAKVKAQGLRNGYLMAIAPTSSISILVGTTQAIEPVYKRKWYEDNLSGMIPVVVPNLTLDNWHCYVPAYELDQIKLIEAAAVRQKYIDQGQSLNIFIDPKKAKASYLSSIYQTAYKLNLKSTYYLRSESPDEKEFDTVDRSIECQGCQ
nr:MAG TPA: ribonucleotide-diphosphate reductase subunit alpha [Bacteriophage sp.]